MGSEYNPASKAHYDISLSKRTRKPLSDLQKEVRSSDYPEKESPNDEEEEEEGEKEEEEEEEEEEKPGGKQDREETEHKSLKQLIRERSPLGRHFTEDQDQGQGQDNLDENDKAQQKRQLQLVVVKQHEEDLDLDGVKLKKLVRRYARVLSRLIKVKGKRHKPPPPLPLLPMQ